MKNPVENCLVTVENQGTSDEFPTFSVNYINPQAHYKLNVIRAECRLDYREPGLLRKTKTPFDVIAISQQSLPFGYQYGQYGVIGTGGGI